MSRTIPTSSPLGAVGRFGDRPLCSGAPPDEYDGFGGAVSLPPPGGSVWAPPRRFGETSTWCDTVLVPAAVSRGALGPFQGGHERQFNQFGPPLDGAIESAAQHFEFRPASRKGVVIYLASIFEGIPPLSPPPGLTSNCTLPMAPLRSLYRPLQPVPLPEWRPTSGPVGLSEKHTEVREVCSAGTGLQQLPCEPSRPHPCRRTPLRGLPARHSQVRNLPPVRPQLKGGYIGDFFSGSSSFARAGRKAGFSVREWDLLTGGNNADLTKEHVLRHIRQEISKGRLFAAMVAPPCSSWSMMNRSVSRTHSDPWGVNGQPSPVAFEKVKVGNSCARAALRIIRDCNKFNLPWALEHPRSSRLFWTREFQNLMQQDNVIICDLDQCQYGTPWRKSTRVLVGNVPEQDCIYLFKKCFSGRDRCCSRSGKRHVILQGKHPSGLNWTAIAAAYPRKLSEALVRTLTSNLRVCKFGE